MAQIVVDPRLPVLHELAIELLREQGDKCVTVRPEAGVRVGDGSLRPTGRRAKLDGQPAGSNARRDLEHFDKARCRLVAGDVPDGVDGFSGSDEDTIRLGKAGGRCNPGWIPTLDPVGLAHRAKKREHGSRVCDQTLGIASRGADWFDDLHGPGQWCRWIASE